MIDPLSFSRVPIREERDVVGHLRRSTGRLTRPELVLVSDSYHVPYHYLSNLEFSL